VSSLSCLCPMWMLRRMSAASTSATDLRHVVSQVTPLDKAEAVLAAMRGEVTEPLRQSAGHRLERRRPVQRDMSRLLVQRTGGTRHGVTASDPTILMTPLDKAEAVLAAMRGEIQCRCCHEYFPRDQMTMRYGPISATSFNTIAKLRCCQGCYSQWPLPGRRATRYLLQHSPLAAVP
jgi:hypothetical protein